MGQSNKSGRAPVSTGDCGEEPAWAPEPQLLTYVGGSLNPWQQHQKILDWIKILKLF